MPPAGFLGAIMAGAVLMLLLDVASHGSDGAPAIWASARHRRRPLPLGDVSTGLHRYNIMFGSDRITFYLPRLGVLPDHSLPRSLFPSSRHLESKALPRSGVYDAMTGVFRARLVQGGKHHIGD